MRTHDFDCIYVVFPSLYQLFCCGFTHTFVIKRNGDIEAMYSAVVFITAMVGVCKQRYMQANRRTFKGIGIQMIFNSFNFRVFF